MLNLKTKRSRSLLLTALLTLGCALFVPVASAVEQRTGSTFDHVQTGFPLLGAHARSDCQTCHLQGIFKGTPRQCEYCHTQGSRISSTFKPANHPQTLQTCSKCHTSQTTWSGARYDHIGVAPGTCATCHNGVTATGKPGSHIITTQPCDQCHRTTAWVPAGYDHSAVVAGTCEALCHRVGGGATPRPGGSHPATGVCSDCHRTVAWLPTISHTNAVPGQCATCHNGTTAVGTSGSSTPHIPIAQVAGGSCDACHNYTNAAGFAYDTFAHRANQGVVTGGCLTCHNGGYTGMNAQSMTSTGYNHFPALVGTCDTCHSATAASFRTYTFSHATQGITITPTFNCMMCHNGSHRFGGERLRGPPGDHNGLPNNAALGTCANSGCHTSFSEWGRHGNNEAFRHRLKMKKK